jgi:5-methylcytosine-specific restriction endonuclease McrA
VKHCKKCGKDYPATLEYFYADSSSKDGLRSPCRACSNEASRLYYQKNKEKIRNQRRLYNEQNADKRRQQQRLYYQRHSEKVRKGIRRWRQENLDQVHERDRLYYQQNADQRRDDNRRRRAQRLNAIGTHTPDDVDCQIRSQTDAKGVLHCWWCGEPIEDEYHVDHRIPLSKGGKDDPGNLVIAHPKCNRSKFNKLPHEFNGRLL